MSYVGIVIGIIIICALVICCWSECISELCYDGAEPVDEVPVANPITII
tara:strand:- start:226 stop:372 length:147 start_codon:yes stop_codon:yes gene_type:complete